jgi:hypothetical protein
MIGTGCCGGTNCICICGGIPSPICAAASSPASMAADEPGDGKAKVGIEKPNAGIPWTLLCKGKQQRARSASGRMQKERMVRLGGTAMNTGAVRNKGLPHSSKGDVAIEVTVTSSARSRCSCSICRRCASHFAVNLSNSVSCSCSRAGEEDCACQRVVQFAGKNDGDSAERLTIASRGAMQRYSGAGGVVVDAPQMEPDPASEWRSCLAPAKDEIRLIWEYFRELEPSLCCFRDNYC